MNRGEAPRFGHDDGYSRGYPRHFFWVMLAIVFFTFVAVDWVLVPNPRTTVPVFAVPGASCAYVVEVLSRAGPAVRQFANLGPCKELPPDWRPSDVFGESAVAIVADLNSKQTGVTEGYSVRGSNTIFSLIRINPKTMDSLTLPHELSHWRQGHPAILLDLGPLEQSVMNAFLDEFFVAPNLVFGERWRMVMFGILLILAAGIKYLWR